MRNTWTRERIIRHILEREAEGRPLAAGGKGADHQLYSAARRIFGSWRNAIVAAGIPPERVLTWERWSPGKILARIRSISRRRRPLTTDQVEQRYHNLVSAARRHFGSWSKAVMAAGVDPTKMQRVVPWTRERVIEAILTRALRSEPLVARLVEPRSLVDSGQRFFGGWQAAVAAAGLDPRVTDMPPRRRKRSRPGRIRAGSAGPPKRVSQSWSKELVIEAICARVREHQPMNAWAVSRDHAGLYGAAKRYLTNWDEAIRAAGLDPAEHRRKRPPSPRKEPPSQAAARKAQGDELVRPDRTG
jgi:hypothetical protein